MRRPLALLVAAFLSLSALTTVVVATSSPATAAGTLKGKLASSADPGLLLGGMTVSMRTVTATGPGLVVDTDTTDASGRFELDAGPTPEDEYYVEVGTTGQYHGGFVGAGYVQPTADDAQTYGADDSLGKVLVVPSFIRGVLVNSRTGRPVRGVKVAARSDNDASQFEGSDVTNAKGVFKIKGIECEDDCYLKLNGNPSGYENGFRACPGTVVASFGDACASPLGNIGKVRIDHL